MGRRGLRAITKSPSWRRPAPLLLLGPDRTAVLQGRTLEHTLGTSGSQSLASPVDVDRPNCAGHAGRSGKDRG